MRASKSNVEMFANSKATLEEKSCSLTAVVPELTLSIRRRLKKKFAINSDIYKPLPGRGRCHGKEKLGELF